MAISEEERQKRSERIRQLHAEGRVGGAQFGKLGGRPPKKRASELVAEKAAENANLIWSRLKDMIEQDDNDKLALEAIKHVTSIEEQERKAAVEQEVRYEQLKHNDLAELVIGNLFELVRSGQIDLGEIIDAEVIEEREVAGLGEGDGRIAEETSSAWTAD